MSKKHENLGLFPSVGWAILCAVIIGLVVIVQGQPIMASNSGNGSVVRYGGQYYPGEFVLYSQPSIWSKYGVDVEHIIFSSGGEGNEALISGVVDVNVGADTKTVVLFGALPQDIVIIGVVAIVFILRR